MQDRGIATAAVSSHEGWGEVPPCLCVPELCTEIWGWLPPAAAFQQQLVCRNWNALLANGREPWLQTFQRSIGMKDNILTQNEKAPIDELEMWEEESWKERLKKVIIKLASFSKTVEGQFQRAHWYTFGHTIKYVLIRNFSTTSNFPLVL
jgi:hypothetical protein